VGQGCGKGRKHCKNDTKTNAKPSIFTRSRPQNSFVTCPFFALHADLTSGTRPVRCDRTSLHSRYLRYTRRNQLAPKRLLARNQLGGSQHSRFLCRFDGISPGGGARDNSHILFLLDKPSAVDGLFSSLDFHQADSINLLPTAVDEDV